MSEEHYRMIFEYDKEEGVYFVRFPELPGCLAHGKTLQEALESAAKTRDQWLEANRIAGWDVPVAAQVKPLTWKTGPVPKGLTVFYQYFIDGFGIDYEVGDGGNNGNISGNINIEWGEVRWLPLSDILALIGGE